jgi:polar amino acid transport system substrate-binding protein
MRSLARRLLPATLATLLGAALPAAAAPASATTPAAHAPRPDCSRPLSLGLHEHGLLYSSQTGEGIDKDIADELARRSGCRLTLTLLPRARIWQLIESGAMDFSLSGISNESRATFADFAWYFSNKYYLLMRNDTGARTLADFEADPALRLGVIRSFRYGPSANRFVDELDAAHRVDHATGLASLYQVLLDKRLQAMIIEPFDYPTLQSAAIRAQTTIIEFDDPPVRHGLIMSKKALTARQRAAWRTLVDGMRADGTMRRIFEKYFKPELAQAMTTF